MNKIKIGYSVEAGWVRFKHNAAHYTAFGVVAILLSGLVSSVLSSIITPILGNNVYANMVLGSFTATIGFMITLGWAYYARADHQGLHPSFDAFFEGFKHHKGKLLVLGVLFGVLTNAALFLLPEDFLTSLESLQTQSNPDELMFLLEDLADSFSNNLSKFVLILCINFLASLIVMFAPYRISFEGEAPLKALNWSAQQALQNIVPILMVNIILAFITILGAVVTLFLGLLALIPYTSLVQYDMYYQLVPDIEEPLDWKETDEKIEIE